MMQENENKKHRIRWVIVLTIIILLLIILHIFVKVVGRIGYVNTSTEPIHIIEVSENDIGWDLLENLSIFNNEKYAKKNIIAPGSYGTYSFMIVNKTNKSILYEVQLREVNKYQINMKYKLKLDHINLVGTEEEWKNAKDINLESIILEPQSSRVYTLEWCWMDDNKNDTEIGKLNYADYTLRMKIGAQMY